MRRARKRTIGRCSSSTRSCSPVRRRGRGRADSRSRAAPRRPGLLTLAAASMAIIPPLLKIKFPLPTRYFAARLPADSTHRAHRAQPDLGRNLAGGNHRQARQDRLQPALDVIAGRTRTKKHGQGRGGGGTDKLPHRIGEPANDGVPGLPAPPAAAGPVSGASVARISSSSAGSSSSTGKLALAVEQRLHQPASQRLARGLDQRDQALVHGAVSSSASRIVPRSRIETRSRSNCSRTRPPRPGSAAWAPALRAAWDGSRSARPAGAWSRRGPAAPMRAGGSARPDAW
jgi:hypothetical protein